ncbi:MAG: NUDIX domain-containing protein [Candidatus Nanohaloarchaeota archaeon QJJ-9]|nr:NUDIX domain-containing protein [Candidatus Nanohaloarchaeota archaeon QJJ-9]
MPEEKWETKERNTVYANLLMELQENKVVTPSGTETTRNLIKMDSSLVVIAKDDSGNFYMTEDVRYATNKKSLEFINGGISEEEDPEDAAEMKVDEELGIQPQSVELIGEIYPFNSLIDSKAYILLAEGFAEQDTDELRKVDEESIEEVLADEVSDALTLSAWAKYRANL